MDIRDILIRSISRYTDSILRVAKAFPPDKLTWTASPQSRSVLDQLQELATAEEMFRAAHTDRKITLDSMDFPAWMESRGKLTSIDVLEASTRAGNERLFHLIRGLSDADFDLPVDMPFPGDYKLADIFMYYVYNLSYHEGQINFISNLLLDSPDAE